MSFVQQVLENMWMETFTLRNKSYKFDSRGDINQGYDVTMWRSDKDMTTHVQDIVAEYDPNFKSFTYTNHSTTRQFRELKVSFLFCCP